MSNFMELLGVANRTKLAPETTLPAAAIGISASSRLICRLRAGRMFGKSLLGFRRGKYSPPGAHPSESEASETIPATPHRRAARDRVTFGMAERSETLCGKTVYG